MGGTLSFSRRVLAGMSHSLNYRFAFRVKWSTDGYCNSLSFSSDGQNLAATKSNNNTVLLWNPANGSSTAVIPDAGHVAQFSNNSPDIFVAMQMKFECRKRYIYLFSRDTSTEKWTSVLAGNNVFTFGLGATSLAQFEQFASFKYQILKYRDIETKPTQKCNTWHWLPDNMKNNVNFSSMACQPTSDLKSVLGRTDGTTLVFTISWDTRTHTVKALSNVGSAKVTQLLWSFNDKYIVSGDISGTIRIWNAKDLSWASNGATTGCSIDSLAFCAGDTSLLVASGGKLRFLDG